MELFEKPRIEKLVFTEDDIITSSTPTSVPTDPVGPGFGPEGENEDND